MKKLLLTLALLVALGAEGVCAKYVYPAGATTTTERKVNRRINRYDADKDGELSLEEYEKYREVKTRDERRQERRAKKDGTYISPEETFRAMDTNGDGVVTKEEMLEYEKSLQLKN